MIQTFSREVLKDKKTVNYASQIHLRLEQIANSPFEDRNRLLKQLERFMLDSDDSPGRFETINQTVSKLYSKTTSINGRSDSTDDPNKKNDYLSYISRGIKDIFGYKDQEEPKKSYGRTYNVEMIPKIYKSIIIQLKFIVNQISQTFSTIENIETVYHDASIDPPAFFNPYYCRNYLIGDVIQRIFKLGPSDIGGLDEKYTEIYKIVTFNLSPIIESIFQNGLNIKSRDGKKTLTHPWSLLQRYFNSKGGRSLLKNPIFKLFYTYGPTIIDSKNMFTNERELFYLIYKIHRSQNGCNQSQLFSRFVLEGVCVGKLATWIEIITSKWIEIFEYYSCSSFVKCTGIEELFAHLSVLNKFRLDVDEFHDFA